MKRPDLWRGHGAGGEVAYALARSAAEASRSLAAVLTGVERVEVAARGVGARVWVVGAAQIEDGPAADEVVGRLVARVASLHGLAAAAVLGRGRAPRVAEARKACYWALRRAGWSLPTVGRALGRDHSTIVKVLAAYEPAPHLVRELEALVLSSDACRPNLAPASES